MNKELHGTTLKVYLHILKRGKDKIGVRELMRELGMKTPSHAYYHLDKLVSLGLLEKKYGDYYLNRNVKIDYLRNFIIASGFIIPKFLFYTMFYLVILIFSMLMPRYNELYWYITLASSIVGVITSLYQTIISYRRIRIM